MASDTAAHLPADTAQDTPQDTAKRRQILDGARRTFMAMGFDGASMGQIARAAGVSKGTLYVYFDSKEALFQTIAADEIQSQGAVVFSLEADDPDIEKVLTRLGKDFVRFVCMPERMPMIRTIIAICERMPEVGRKFFEAGPANGIARLTRYLVAQNDAGMLTIDDPELAAIQFLEACLGPFLKPLLLCYATVADESEIDRSVRAAVRVFLAAYRTGPNASANS
jgi:AcrR family transcriptional regulator